MKVLFFLAVVAFVLACNNEHPAQTTSELQDSVDSRANDAALEKRLGDPNSPYRNEEQYVKLLQSQLQSNWYSAREKEAIQQRLTLVLQNSKGQAANDFVFIRANGTIQNLYAVKADYIVLFFYNPECGACKEMKEKLVQWEVESEKWRAGNGKILAIYTDKDERVWRKHLADMPKDWIHGRDDDEYLWKNKVYDLRAIPTVYLLDKNKKVLLKDCQDVGMIEKAVNGVKEYMR